MTEPDLIRQALRKVAYLGNPTDPSDRSTFGTIATHSLFQRPPSIGKRWKFQPKADHRSVIEALWHREVEYGVVAIENGIDGVVNECARGVAKLAARGIHVLEELVMPVKFYLATVDTVDLKKPITLFAHPTAAGQCMGVQEKLFALCGGSENVTVKLAKSNGMAAEFAAKNNSGNSIAIVNWDALEAKGLKLIDINKKATAVDANELNIEGRVAYQIGDYDNATTRFWKLGYGQFSKPIQRETNNQGKKIRYNRTSLLLNLDHDSPGGLSDALAHFSAHQCNLSIVFPIPIPGRQFEYSFLLEFEDNISKTGELIASGHIDGQDGKLKSAYQALAASGLSLNQPTIFGAYGTHIEDCDQKKTASHS